jgi:hypothetical protein
VYLSHTGSATDEQRDMAALLYAGPRSVLSGPAPLRRHGGRGGGRGGLTRMASFPREWERTLARHARMSAHGIIVLHFTPGQIRTRPHEVASAIGDALAVRRAIPRP